MGLPVRQQIIYWSAACVVFLLLLWYLGPVLLPFLVGGAIAYILDPLADRLQRLGLPRVAATAVITLVGLLLLVVAIAFLVPQLVEQATALIGSVPQYFDALRNWLETTFPQTVGDDGFIQTTLGNLGEMIRARGGSLAQDAVKYVSGVVNALVFLVVVPVVAFYLLLDWDNMVARIDELVPREHLGRVRRIARDVDDTLAGFLRGQATVCLILGTFYSLSLMLVGLQFGLVVGAVAGLVTFIPYVGAIIGGVLAIGLALFQFWGEWYWIAAVAGIFVFGQFIEGNVLTPNLVGSSVGLHPVWLLFALSAFGSIFGFVGMLVAVPVAAVIGVLARHGVAEYRDSPLYSGRGDPGEHSGGIVPDGPPPIRPVTRRAGPRG